MTRYPKDKLLYMEDLSGSEQVKTNGCVSYSNSTPTQLFKVATAVHIDSGCIPHNVIEFCSKYPSSFWATEAAEVLGPTSSLYADLMFVFEEGVGSPLVRAIINDRPELVEYLTSQGCASSGMEYATKAAARLGKLNYLQLLHKNGYPWSADTCRAAAAGGNVDCLAYAHANGCGWSVETYLAAVEDNNLSCMQFAHENGLEWHPDVCSLAAKCANLACLKYAHTHGCPWDERVTLHAAQVGSVECLEYALQHRCPLHRCTALMIVAGGHLACLQLLGQYHTGTTPWEDVRLPAVAACKGHLHMIIHLHERGCPWDAQTTTNASDYGHLDIYRYAEAHGCACSEDPDLALLLSLDDEDDEC